MIEGGWHFINGTFDVPPDEKGKYHFDRAPFLDYEFAGIVVDRILLPWRSQVLHLLSDLSFANKKSNWFALLLANFVLQHTYGLLMRQQRALAIEYRQPVSYNLKTIALLLRPSPFPDGCDNSSGSLHIYVSRQ